MNMNMGQYKNIKSCIKILHEQNLLGVDNCDHSLRNHCVNLLESFSIMFDDFDAIQDNILLDLGIKRCL